MASVTYWAQPVQSAEPRLWIGFAACVDRPLQGQGLIDRGQALRLSQLCAPYAMYAKVDGLRGSLLEEVLMYAVIRKIRMRSVDEAGRRAIDGLGPVLKQSSGFIGYHIVKFGSDTGGSISLFESREAAQAAHAKAMSWIRENLADLTDGEPEVVEGEVLGSVVADKKAAVAA
jgi:hypothetical protein